jgi:hypothetical protein
VLKPGRGDIEALRKRLEGLGLDIGGMDRVMPSLEDVFLDVVEKSA